MPDFAYQLYSARNAPSLAGTLGMLKDVGYTAVEGYGALYADAAKVDELKAALGDTGLAMPTAHFALDMLERDPGRVLEIARDLGIGTVYVPFLAPADRPADSAGYHAFGARLAEAGKAVRDAGLGFGWHNHAFEFEALPDGGLPQVAIFEGGPELEWEADIAWIAKAGADPFHWIGAYADRLTSAHIKDIAPEGENADEDGWADVGHGTLDWKRLMAALEGTGARHFIVEHDNPKDPARFAERSLAALRSY
jgi:sugar phosphate isomerase/epimerase